MLKLNHRAGHCQNRVTYISCLPLRIQLICDCALLHIAADTELGPTQFFPLPGSFTYALKSRNDVFDVNSD